RRAQFASSYPRNVRPRRLDATLLIRAAQRRMNNTKLLVYQGPPDYTGFSLHTSATDIPVAIWWGQRRITVNVVWVSALQPQASDAAGNPTTQSFGFTPLDGLPFPVNDQSGDIAWPMIFALGEGPMTGPIAISGTATLQHGNAS